MIKFYRLCLKMLQKFLIFPVFLISTHAFGEFSILHSPASLDFKGDDKLETDDIGNVLSASLGQSIYGSSDWGGLYVSDPFNVPKSAIVFLIDGVKNIHLSDKAKTYPLAGDTAQESMNILGSTLESANALVADVDLGQGPDALLTYSDVFSATTTQAPITKTTNSLKPDLHSEDKLFLQQIALINSLSDELPSLMKRPSLLTIRISLSPIASAHGEKSSAMTEAVKLLSEAVENTLEAAKDVFKDDVIFVVVANKVDLSRSKRQAETPKEEEDDLNLATSYSDDYPVIFNIILWFGVVFAFSLLAISYAIASMDPGRDSIIYRMTSTRMKKDN